MVAVELAVRAHPPGGRWRDLIVAVEPEHRIADLAEALAVTFGLATVRPALSVVRLGGVLDPDLAVVDAGIHSGDDLLVDPPSAPARVPAMPLRAVTVDVLSGPESGTSVIVMQGRYRIGRDPAMDICIDDPTVAPHQLDLAVGPDWSVTVHPVGGVENPLTVNGQPVTTAVVVSGDDVIGLGTTRLASRRFVRTPGERRDQLGQVEFQRTPYRPLTVSERPVAEVGPIPSRPEPRRFQVLTVLAPLVAGLTMFAFSGQLQYLALTGLSPVAMVGNWYEDRRSGRNRFAADAAAFRERLVQRRAAVATAAAAERVERLRAAPDLAELARRAELRTVDLWARGRHAPDFLVVRLGLGRSATRIVVPAERGGDETFRAELESAGAGADQLDDVPVTVDLADAGVLAIHGDPEAVVGAAASCLIQAACLHSPEDLTIAGALDEHSTIAGWLKWLPHCRSVTSPLSGTHVCRGAAADELIRQLLEVAEFRIALPERERAERAWPRLLLVADAAVDVDPVALSKLLDLAGQTGIQVIWLARHEADLPRQATSILQCHAGSVRVAGSLWSTDPTVPTRGLEVDQLRADIADRTARALAPVRDASAGSATTSIPRVAPLLDVLGVGTPTAAWIAGLWARSAEHYALGFPIGLGADGPLHLDLVEDGPHTLIGGTSGAGKSELLQSMVAALACHHDPRRLNFLFIDYKGGASSTVFTTLAHTVGYVTNLSAELSRRALTSLRAELNRRMRIMEGRAKDLREMIELDPDAAPPSLLIVVDEFATLVKEVPDFVAGVVDIAQRGRSLGIHLVLATQRPSGSVNDNILANTNLRISLRMLDRAESSSVIGSPEAADIPVPLRGRGYVRLGPRALVPFQSSYCSAPLLSEALQTPVLVGEFADDRSSVKASGPSTAGERTHLDAVLDAIAAATAEAGIPAPRQPWREVLGERVTLDEVLADPRATVAATQPGRLIPLGLLDLPEEQDQAPLVVDLEDGGGCLVFGSGGSGKTTLLRTAAAAAARLDPGGRVEIVGFDFASRGLGSIAALPQVIEVATGDDLDAVTRLIAVLDAELSRRRVLLADARAEHLTAYNARHTPLPRILVLIDGYGGLLAAFASSAGSMSVATPMDAWPELVATVAVEGRQVGMHTIITADRRTAVPPRLHSAVSNRVILRHADESGYTDHGVALARAKGLVLAPGRGLWEARDTLQVASVSADPSSPAQAAAISELAERLRAAHRVTSPSSIRSAGLPDALAADRLGDSPSPDRIPLGLADVTGAVVTVDLAHSPLSVIGPPGSGRSTALAHCATALAGSHDLWVVGPPTSPLAGWLPVGVEGTFAGDDAIGATLERLDATLGSATDRPQVLIVDDLDRLDENAHNPAFERLLRAGVRVVAALETRAQTSYSMNALLVEVRRARRVLLLQPADGNEVVQLFGVRPPLRPGVRLPAGRGVVIDGRSVTLVQVPGPVRTG